MDPKITVIIPTFNRAHCLSESIESALAQEYPHLEVIVCDNASTDSTPGLVRKYLNDTRFRYERNDRNIGLVANFRKAIGLVNGDFFMYLGDDDYLTDTRFVTKAVRLVRERPDIVMVYANGQVLNADTGQMTPLHLPFQTIEDGKVIFLSRGTVRPIDFILCNVLFRTDVARGLKPFRNEKNLSADSELFLKMCLQGPVAVIHDFVSLYRMHPGSVTFAIARDADLLVNNVDYLVGPYRLARDLGVLSEAELRDWEKRLVLPELKSTLLALILLHRDRFRIGLRSLTDRHGELIGKIMRHPAFRLRLFIAGTSRTLYYCCYPSYRREVARQKKRLRSKSVQRDGSR
jgi:glycosyltransferase involved in cell wall biosynthesis